MKKSTKNILRWIGVLPGAIICGFLATFPLHWALYSTLADGSFISGVNIDPIEYALYPFVIAFTFIFAGFKIAPNYKFKTALILAVFWLALFATVFLIMPESEVELGIRSFGSLVGLCLGLYVVWKKSNTFKLDSKSKEVAKVKIESKTNNDVKAELAINPKRTGDFYNYSKTMGRDEAIDVYEMWLLHIRYYHPKLDILFQDVTIPTFFLPVPMELLQEVPKIIKKYKNANGIYENEELIEHNIGKYAHRYYPRSGNDKEIISGIGNAINDEESFDLMMSKIRKNKDDWYFEYKEL